MKKIKKVLDSGSSFEDDYRIIKADGQVRWVVARGYVARDGNGKPINFPGILVDITERKMAEQAYKESEERFRAVQESSPDGFFLMKSL